MEFVHVFAFGGEKQNGDVQGFPDSGDHGKAVHFRHHDVHDSHGRVVFAEDFQAFQPVFSLQDVKACVQEVYGNGFPDALVVFNNQNLVIHRFLPP